jgi:hypothetical protein
MIVAGSASEIVWGEGNWMFLDIGFSGAANTRGKTSGLLVGEGEPHLVTFSAAAQTIAKTIADSRSHRSNGDRGTSLCLFPKWQSNGPLNRKA